MCEWIDKTGIGWAVDWGAYHQVRLAGFETAVEETSVFYHYAHVTIYKMDKRDPSWTKAPMDRYRQKWGTFDKELPPLWRSSRYLLEGDVLIQAP